MKRTAGDIVKEKDAGIISIPASASLREALTQMIRHRVGAILAESTDPGPDERPYMGIWTERDLMKQVVEDGFDLDKDTVEQRMSTELSVASADEQVYQLYDKFLGRRVRHLLIEKAGQYIGVLSMGDVIRASLQQRIQEYKELNEMVSLEYYENWKARQNERF